MNKVIQGQVQSGLAQTLSTTTHNIKRFTHDTTDNAPYRAIEKCEVNPFSGNVDHPDAHLHFRVPRLGHLNRLWLRVSLFMPVTAPETYADPASAVGKPRGPEFFASFFDSADILVGGKCLETIYAENVLHDAFRHTGPAAESVLYGLKGFHSDYSQMELGDLGSDVVNTASGGNLPQYATVHIPLNFSVFHFHKDALDTGFLQDIQVIFRKHAIRGMQEGQAGAYTRAVLMCRYHNFHPHFKNQVRNANFQHEPSTLVTNRNINFKQTPTITHIPEVSTSVYVLGPKEDIIFRNKPSPEVLTLGGYSGGDEVMLSGFINASKYNAVFTLVSVGPDIFTLLGDTLTDRHISLITKDPGLPIEIFLPSESVFGTGTIMTISGYDPSTQINGTWTLTEISSTIFTLDGSELAPSGTYLTELKIQHVLDSLTVVTQQPATRYTYQLDLDCFVTDILITFRKKEVDAATFVGEVQPTPSEVGYTRFILRGNDRVLFDKMHHEMQSESLGAAVHDVQDMSHNDQSRRFFGLASDPVKELALGDCGLPADTQAQVHRSGDIMYRIPLAYILTDEFQSGGLDLSALVNAELIIESEGMLDEFTPDDRRGLEPSIVLRCRTLTRVDGRTGSVYVQV